MGGPRSRSVAGGGMAAAVSIAAGTAAAIHVAAIGPHLEESRLFAFAFVAMALSQGGWMVLVTVAPSPDRYTGGAVLNGGIALLWLLSRTWGVPVGPHPFAPEPVGTMDALATMAEVVAASGSLALARGWRRSGRRGVRSDVPRGLVELGVVTLASGFVASLAATTGPHGVGSHTCCGSGSAGHVIILAGMLTVLAGVLTLAVRGGGRPASPARGRRIP